MTETTGTHLDDTLNLVVYLCLLGLTGATLTASFLRGGGRLLAIAVALLIAATKASFIGFYYMGLRRERAFVWGVLAVGLLAVLILFVGILPDVTFYPR